MAENSCIFMSYNEFQNLIRWTNHIPQREDLSLSLAIVAAAGAGAVTSFVLSVHFSLLFEERSDLKLTDLCLLSLHRVAVFLF